MAAVAVADAEGLEAITMRRLATELGVAPMAPYRYVSGKDDLLELMVDHVYAGMRLPGGLGWRESLHALAVGTRELMLEHRWLARLPPQAKLALTPRRMAVAEQSLMALDGLGLDPDMMMGVFRGVDAYVQGAMSYDSAVDEFMSEQSLSSGDELRTELAPSWPGTCAPAITPPTSTTCAPPPARTTGNGSSTSASTASSMASPPA
ncbi:TetR/AcrR family transcriptional regulator C-terminal domain-containing protein [Nonomuraea recticatena]|uniref:TetR/AcrR family transcriptional regulator C-terminal domain-containing protein n=1 Tax=Nonomuraea recticatena TaxID=46178 RepID=UPI00360F5F47